MAQSVVEGDVSLEQGFGVSELDDGDFGRRDILRILHPVQGLQLAVDGLEDVHRVSRVRVVLGADVAIGESHRDVQVGTGEGETVDRRPEHSQVRRWVDPAARGVRVFLTLEFNVYYK